MHTLFLQRECGRLAGKNNHMIWINKMQAAVLYLSTDETAFRFIILSLVMRKLHGSESSLFFWTVTSFKNIGCIKIFFENSNFASSYIPGCKNVYRSYKAALMFGLSIQMCISSTG